MAFYRILLIIGLLLMALGLLKLVLPRSEARSEILTTGKKLYSQRNEELIIRDFFQDREEGFFVDVGCGPARKNSTTYYLEKHLDWAGIGVDALAEYADEYLRERPKTRFFNYIVTDHSGTIEPFYRVETLVGMSSTNPDREWKGEKLPTVMVEVPTITLTHLLDRAGVEKIDLLSMDIEDSTPVALDGFEIERFRPELAVVESGDLLQRAKLKQYFSEHGYALIDEYAKHDLVNFYFKPAD